MPIVYSLFIWEPSFRLTRERIENCQYVGTWIFLSVQFASSLLALLPWDHALFRPYPNHITPTFSIFRPWRPGKVSIEPPDMELERAGIRALLFRERTVRPTHSELIVGLLAKAIEQYRTFRSPRAQSHLSVQMAEEMMVGQKYQQALDLLRPIVAQYRRQGKQD